MAEIKVYKTGIRTGEFIIGTKDTNKGTIFEVKGEYPPSKKGVEELLKSLDSKESKQVKSRLADLDFSSDMDREELEEYLISVQSSNNDLYLGDTKESLMVKLIKLGGGYMIEHFSDISMDKWYSIKELEDMIPRKSLRGGRNGRHTLIFRPTIWEIYQEEVVKTWNGIYINLCEDTEVVESKYKLEKGYIIRPINEEIAIVYKKRKKLYEWTDLYLLVPEEYREGMKVAKELLEIFNFPPSFYKSFIQKLIRFKSTYCYVVDVRIDSMSALLASIGLLFLHPGSFVPNIQKFSRGIESAFKRVAVSICEDSWTARHEDMLAIYSCAILGQREIKFTPEAILVEKMFSLAIDCQQELKRFEWRLKSSKLSGNTSLNMCATLLKEHGTFETDVKMTEYIASVNGRHDTLVDQVNKNDTMYIYQSIDHHTNPTIAYFLEYPKWDMEYPELFKAIWDLASSYNPRKINTVDTKKYTGDIQDMQSDIKNAQELFFMSKYQVREKKEIKETKKTKMIKYTLDASWLAGLIGPIQVKNAFVVLKTDEISNFTAIKKPSRNSKVPELKENQKTEVIKEAVKLLTAGIKIKNCPKSLDRFKNAVVKFSEEEETYKLQIDGKLIDWIDCTSFIYTIPLHAKINGGILEAITFKGNSIEALASSKLDEILESLELEVLRRILSTITGRATTIELGKIGRDGFGVDYTVSIYDTAVFQFLCLVCCLYPVALKLSGVKFIIKNGPIFWHIRKKIAKKLINNRSCEYKWEVKSDDRSMWEHQKEVVNTMIKRNKSGKKGNIIWMNTGYGKSFCVTQYIHYLIRESKMPQYCIWAIPPSARESIEKEIKFAGIPYVVVDFTKSGTVNKKTATPQKTVYKTIQKGVVNIVFHDHLRMRKEELRSISNECLFIVDEFHKSMSKTKRTSIILDLVKLSYDFVALSGTIVKDNHIDELIIWLQQIVEFEVNPTNYWVAVGALISRKVETKVMMEREFVEVESTPEYYTHVPKNIGGTASVINFKKALEQTYLVVTNKIIEIAKEYLERGEKIFIVAKDMKNQDFISRALGDYKVFNITAKTPIDLSPDTKSNIDVVITTTKHCEGYTLSLLHIGITGCWFSNQATRDQLEGRLNRLNQKNDTITWITVHSGILTYILDKYENVRTLSEALKGFAKAIDVDVKTIRTLL
jgi:hypothetical protein